MTNLTPFRAARPAMIVGRAFGGGPAPLSLSEPFALNGGDRLGPDGIAFDLMLEDQPAFVNWVSSTCQALVAAERPWFRGSPVLLTGREGGGRTHAARRLARVAGVPHVILNLTDPVIAANFASSGRVNENLWASPITIAMAAERCANPIVTVIGIDRVVGDVAAGLVAMIDPETGRVWSEDRLETHIDLGEVTWLIQCDDPARVPAELHSQAARVAFKTLPRGTETSAVLSVMLEVIDDLGLDEADPALDWSHVAWRLSGYHSTVKELYFDMTKAVLGAARRTEPNPETTIDF